ncbi:arylesterase [Altererythrobacter sp. GH1-8]|uniref:arylesterase n=1 Tax=Altererythrobacter sp. GH1-8 TaxID=3349333 RepID=UPI00374DB639
MQNRLWSIILSGALALSLTACGSNAPDSAPGEAGAAERSGTNDSDLPEVPVMGPEKRILAFGNSLFAGYNVAPEDSYPAKLQRALRAQGINAQVYNAGVSGDTTAAGRQRLAFALDEQETKPDLAIVELGGNDLLRGLSPEQSRENLAAMIEELQSRDIDVLLMGMRAPPNYGPEYQAAFDGMYGELAKKYGVDLYPFFLEAIYQDPSLFQSDRIHPTEDGIERLVEATLETVVSALPESVE